MKRDGEAGAAMEPPGEGRYESGRAGLVVVELPAAMEPPGEGRYETPTCAREREEAESRNGAAR